MTSRGAWWVAACVAALAVTGCAEVPPDQDPVQIRLKDLDTRLTRIERVVANQSLLDLANQVEALRTDVRAMHNDIDVINHNLDSARKQQRDLYSDLDQRLKALELHGVVPGASAGAAAAGTGGATDSPDKASYQAAFDLLKTGQYDGAIAGFQAFLTTYPSSSLADNAQYWLGEANYVNRAYPEAQSAFQRVVDKYPTSRKVPDAVLKIGYCEYELKDFASARTALTQVTVRYPDSSAAPLAKQRLDKMAAEGH